jgi:2-oxoisovalerate dehydrogenase E1 component
VEPEVVELFLRATRIRRIEEKLLEAFAAGRIDGTIHTCIGQELSALALCGCLGPDDSILSTHRCHGHYLARFGDARPLVAELMGMPSGICRGFGGSQHLYRPGFFSSGIQGGQTPASVGMALARKLSGAGGIVVAIFGDGTLGQGVVYESFNLASRLGVPLLYVLEDNLYAQSTHQSETLAGTVEGRARAFELAYFHSSTFDLDGLLGTAREATDHVRRTGRPALLHVSTYRLAPHSKGDDLRDPAEVAAYRGRDLVARFLDSAAADPELRGRVEAVEREVTTILEEVAREERSVVVPDPRAAGRDAPAALLFQRASPFPERVQLVREINRALLDLMRADPGAIVLGEDLRDPYGGAFKVTRGLSTEFPGRVFNMPISEAGLVGAGLGLALEGRTCIVEIMFGDFLGLAFDQILNHAGKSALMYGSDLRVPLLIRTPSGGRRGFGATHSQSLEKHFLGIPGTDLYVLHPHVDAYDFYRKLGAGLERTSIVIESKQLYGSPLQPSLPRYACYRSNERFPTTRLTTDRPSDVTVVCFGGIGVELEKAATLLLEDEIFLDIFYPLDIGGCSVEPMLESARETGRVLFVEEGTDTGTLGAELARRMSIRLPRGAHPAMRFVAARERPIPSATYLEQQVLPDDRRIYAALLDVFDE